MEETLSDIFDVAMARSPSAILIPADLPGLLRTNGAQSGCIVTGDVDAAVAIAAAQGFPGLKGMDLAREVTYSPQLITGTRPCESDEE